MRNISQYMRQTQIRVIIGAIFLIFILGDGLIYFIYGPNSALLGLLCLLGGSVPVILIITVLKIIDWSVNRANRE